MQICAGTKSLVNPEHTLWSEPSRERKVFLPELNCFDASGQEGELSVGMVVGAVFAILFLMLACVGFVLWRYGGNGSIGV